MRVINEDDKAFLLTTSCENQVKRKRLAAIKPNNCGSFVRKLKAKL